MREQVAQAAGGAALGGNQDAVFTQMSAGAETLLLQIHGHAVGQGLLVAVVNDFMFVRKRGQRLLGDVFAEIPHFLHHAGRIAVDAQAGGSDQEGQDHEKPAGVIDIVEPQQPERFEPVRAELDDVIVVGLGLLQHGADDGGDGQQGQQGDGEAHGAEKLVQGFAEGFVRTHGLFANKKG